MARTQKLQTYSQTYYTQVELPLDAIRADRITLATSTPVLQMEDIHLLYVQEGGGILQVNGLDFPVRPGSLALLFPFHMHSIRVHPGGTMEVCRCSFPLSLMMYMDVKNRNGDQSITALNVVGPVIALEPRDAERVGASMAELIEEQALRDIDFHRMMLAGLLRILALYDRQSVRLLHREKPLQRSLGWKALQYIHMHFNAPGISAASVSAQFDTDPLALGHALRMLTGHGFSDTLHEVRVRNACAMMRFEELTVTYIARYVGYQSLATFFRAFKQYKGVTPEQYRLDAGTSGTAGFYPDTAWAIVSYLLDHYAEDLKAADVAERVFVSERTQASILQANFGMGFCALLEHIRLNYACALLGASDLLVCDIAIAVGYNSIRTFSRSFQKHIGASPQQYRRRLEAMSARSRTHALLEEDAF